MKNEDLIRREAMSVRCMACTEALIDNTEKLAALLQSGIAAYHALYLPPDLVGDLKTNQPVDGVAHIESDER